MADTVKPSLISSMFQTQSQEIPKTYEPQAVENHWYSLWLESGCFKTPQLPKEAKGYSIVIPPPNVTGVLTMGHVLNNTIQDILIRRKRQEGIPATWIPGTDHAGIATQTKVIKALADEGLSWRDLGRDGFEQRALKWKDKHGGIIVSQLKKLGASCDWDRLVHTLDPQYSKAVLTVFVELYKRGYIYKGKRMVNWCPKSLTALSDEEVMMQPCKSKLYKVRYEVVELPGTFLEISTTRPETIMGDTAVAVHPEDERYQHLIGKHCYRPFPKEAIPIIADQAVERDFGTGALKVTPAHDPLDFQIGERHNLPILDIMNPDGTLNRLAGADFEGLDRFEARKLAAKKLEVEGLLQGIEDHENNIGYSERGQVPIEPRLSDQWFLKYPKVEEAKLVVKDRLTRFWPARWEKTYLHWLDNIQDWCISRQLWWGHRIPVWYKKGADRNDPGNWHVSLEAPQDPHNWEQEEDVLDTWFSSWLWAFATMGWPKQETQEALHLSNYYPTGDLVTGPDIIFFWVSRMIMASLEFMGPEKKHLTHDEMEARIPFKNVYFTGIIRDEKGRKMSKSLGNSPDPLDLIAQYGADGLRLGIMSMAPQGQDIHFVQERISQGKHYCNKLWNACRFRQMSGPMVGNGTLEAIIARINPVLMDDDDHAILGRTLQTLKALEEGFSNYAFSTITQDLYSFFWGDFCDWYLEVSKARQEDPEAQTHILAIEDLVIRILLQMHHPYTPFITEELWHKMGYGSEEGFIQNAKLPLSADLAKTLNNQGIALNPEAIEAVDHLRSLVAQVRALKAEYHLGATRDVTLYYKAEAVQALLIQNHFEKLQKLIGFKTLEVTTEALQAPCVITALGTWYIDLSSATDVEAEKKRIQTELEKLIALIRSGEAKLSNRSFTDKAPTHVVEGARKLHEANIAKKQELERNLLFLGK